MHIVAEMGEGLAWEGRMRKVVVEYLLVTQAELQRWRRRRLH